MTRSPDNNGNITMFFNNYRKVTVTTYPLPVLPSASSNHGFSKQKKKSGSKKILRKRHTLNRLHHPAGCILDLVNPFRYFTVHCIISLTAEI